MRIYLSGEAVEVWVPELPQSFPDLFPVLIMTVITRLIITMTRMMMMKCLKPHVLLKIGFSDVVSEGREEVNKCLKYGA